MPWYRACALSIACNRDIAALSGAEIPSTPEPADLTIDLSGAGDWPLPRDDEHTHHRSAPNEAGAVFQVSQQPDGPYRFAYSDGIEFLVAVDARSVQGRWPAAMSCEDATEYLLGPILAFVLRLRGIICLHAAVIAAEDGCFAILAPAGHGKSTIAAACARRGWGILTEDLCAIERRDDRFWVVPSYPRIRLWPDAVAGLFGSADALPRITPDNPAWDKRYLDLTGDGFSFQATPLPLRAVYTHERRENAVPTFEPLSPADALVTLLTNVYTRWQLSRAQRAHEFELLHELADAVPAKRYQGPYGLEHVDGNAQELLGDCLRATVGAGRPPVGRGA
jgi:hypothetical protein